MNLVRDVLDKLVVDRNGREMGRVDAIVLELRENRPPIVRALEIGPAVLAARLHPALGRLAATVEEVAGLSEGRPVHLPMTKVLTVSDRVTVDVAIGETGAANVEQRLSRLVRGVSWK